MSLTRFLEDNKDVRERFKEEFPKPKFTLKKEILAPPLSKNYSGVGIAFDYLLRFYVERLNPGAVKSTWIAQVAADRLYAHPDLGRSARTMVAKAKLAYSEYMSTGDITQELLEATLLLSQLDPVYRAGRIDAVRGVVSQDDVADLRELISLVDPSFFLAEKLCVLNPSFGEASSLVGGADADLLVDHTLIDIKCRKRLALPRKDFNPLMGYYVLAGMGGIDGLSQRTEIKTIGIYSARYAELYTIPVCEVVREERLPAFEKWLRVRAAREYGRA